MKAGRVAKAQERQEIEKERAEAESRGEKYRGDRGLSNGSINHVLSDLAQVLETAVEYGLIGANPASGKRRRLKAARPHRPWVEPEQLPALLDAARSVSDIGYALLATLAGSGIRIGEALDLRWSSVDLATGTLHVAASKTDAGVRSVDLTAGLREDMTTWRATSMHTGATDYVFATPSGGKGNPSNLRRDVLRPAVDAANADLQRSGIATLDGITFHSLRRTYASLRCACGDDLRYTSSQLGHTDVRFTMSTYAQATKRRERLSGPHADAYDRALDWARMGTSPLDVPELVAA
jgi:integrase